MKAVYRYVPQGYKNVFIFWSVFFTVPFKMDGRVGVRPEDRILTLYCVSFYFAPHTDRMNTMYCFHLRI